jgi:hypothetical protein
VDPEDEQHLVLRSTSGLMVSRDAGAHWDWRCKAGVGYQGRAEPAVAILNGGVLVLGTPTGIVTGDAAGCDFKRASGIEAQVVDVVALPAIPGAALAVSVSFPNSSSRLWRSLDNGRTFRALGTAIPRFTALSLAVPMASTHRVYVTGLRWAYAVEGVFGVSDDAGKTFTMLPIPSSDAGAQPFIAAVDPGHAETVYIRFSGIPGRLRVSDDAGRTFREVLSIPGQLQGFAISPRGDEAFASSLEAGTYRADAASLDFERVASGGVPCLAATNSALLGCGDASRHGFVVGRSLDRGQSFSALLDTRCLAPARCGETTSVGSKCKEEWPRVSGQFAPGGAPCDPSVPSRAFRGVGSDGSSAPARADTLRAGRCCMLADGAVVRDELRTLMVVLLSALLLRRRRARSVAVATSQRFVAKTSEGCGRIAE